jgi:hypothetical protein
MDNPTNLDVELNIKVKETYKLILKKKDVKITFDNNIDNKLDSTKIEFKNNEFNIFKIIKTEVLSSINNKYYNLCNAKIKSDINSVKNINDKYKIIAKYLKFKHILKHLIGDIIVSETISNFKYYITYNSIMIELTTEEYEKYSYYAKFMFKVQKIYDLNKELNIKQEFNIVFQDDKAAYQIHKNFYENFKDIIEPINSDINDLLNNKNL